MLPNKHDQQTNCCSFRLPAACGVEDYLIFKNDLCKKIIIIAERKSRARVNVCLCLFQQSFQACPAFVYLLDQRGVCVWPGGLRHSLQPPAVLRLPGAAGGAGSADPHRHSGAWEQSASARSLPLQYGRTGCRSTTTPLAHTYTNERVTETFPWTYMKTI